MPIRISRALFIFLSSSVLTIIYHYNLDSDPISSSSSYSRSIDVSLTHQSNRSIIDQWLKHERFCIFHGIHTGTESFRDNSSLLEPITLAVHSTTNLAYMVHNQAVHWEGPISLALYIDHRTAESLPLLLRVIQCDLLLSSRLSLHIVFERSSFQNECFNVSIPLSTEPCEEATMHNFKEFSETNPSPFGEYPINLMRNVARRGAPSLLHLVADIEMEFSSNFTLFVTPLANRIVLPKEKRSLVVRRFEVESRTPVPRSVAHLKRFHRAHKAFEYHHSVFLPGHRIPGLWHWFQVSEPEMEPQSLPMEYMSPLWEPQVILHADDPMNDETIPTRHKDQQALIYELCRAGYHFEVASHGFNVHRGIRNKTSPIELAVTMANKRGRFKALTAYRERLDLTYPDTRFQCGNFTL